MDKKNSLTGFSSLAVHGGHEKDPRSSHLTPIYAASTFVFNDAAQGMRRFSGKEEGYIYSRWGNPSFTEAENKIAALEGFGINDEKGNPLELKALLHASGMAAITTLMLMNLKSGDKILSHYSLYGGSEELLTNLLPALGITAIITDLRDLNKAEEAFKNDPAIKMVFIETPANPTIQCVDIDELTRMARKYKAIVACDNSFATPYLQQPFRYGVDFVMHSTTKFLNGHGTSIGGVLIGRDIALMKSKALLTMKTLGGNANPFDSFLLVNGIKTLELRMDRHCHNAMEVAHFLETHDSIAKVNYTGLTSHPDYYIAAKQMRHPGAMMSFELKKGLQGGIDFMDKLKMCTRTVSLGTCDTLLSHPASMTHYSVPPEAREKYGITDGLIRMSVGIENVQDIIADLNQALS